MKRVVFSRALAQAGASDQAVSQRTNSNNKARINAELKGNTLRVYMYTLRKRKVGVREVQRSLGLSNASLAQYHLNKLSEMGLVKEIGGDYEIVSEIKVDVMRDFLRLGTLIVPRFIFYAVFFTVIAVYFVNISLSTYSNFPIVIWSALLLILASGIFWYEGQKAWRSAPSA